MTTGLKSNIALKVGIDSRDITRNGLKVKEKKEGRKDGWMDGRRKERR